MSASVLVLNRAYMPVGIYANHRKAITKVENKRAEIIATYPDRILKSWKQAMEAPAIIRLLYFTTVRQKSGRFMRLSRKNLWLRDKGRCQFCGQFVPLEEMHWDHVVPRDQGGVSSWQNLVCCDIECNSRKGNRTPAQAHMPLLHVPVAPLYNLSLEKEMMLKLRSLKNLPSESWRAYAYFDAELEP